MSSNFEKYMGNKWEILSELQSNSNRIKISSCYGPVNGPSAAQHTRRAVKARRRFLCVLFCLVCTKLCTKK